MSDDNNIAKLTPVQIAALQEIEVGLMREYDTDKLRAIAMGAVIAKMLEVSIYRRLLGWEEVDGAS